MAMKKHTRLDLVEGGNIFKQGDYVTLGFIPRDYTGASVDLTNKQIEGSIFNGSTGVIYEGPASFVDGKIFFTIKQVLNDGKFQLEFTVTDAADPEYRTKFPTDDYASELTIKPSADNLDYVGVSMTTVAQLRTEQEQKQQQFELAIVPQVDELKQRVEEGIGAFTEDTEVKDARMDEINLRTFNQKVVAQLAETQKRIPNLANASSSLKILNPYGNFQNIHPKVLHFPDGLFDYKWWMHYTPYPGGNTTQENPTIAAANNGLDWEVPVGMDNPMLEDWNGITNSFNNDSHLLYRADLNRLEAWWRVSYDDPYEAELRRRTTTDGKNWTPTEVMFRGSRYGDDHISPALVFENGKYKMLSVNTVDGDRILNYSESVDGKTWGERTPAITEWDGLTPWHVDFINEGDKYTVVLQAWDIGETNNTSSLYHLETTDLITFTKPVKILSPSALPANFDNAGIYRSSIVKVDKMYYLFYSALDTGNRRAMALSFGENIFALKGYSVDIENLTQLPLKNGVLAVNLEQNPSINNVLDVKQSTNGERYGAIKVGGIQFANGLTDGVTPTPGHIRYTESGKKHQRYDADKLTWVDLVPASEKIVLAQKSIEQSLAGGQMVIVSFNDEKFNTGDFINSDTVKIPVGANYKFNVGLQLTGVVAGDSVEVYILRNKSTKLRTLARQGVTPDSSGQYYFDATGVLNLLANYEMSIGVQYTGSAPSPKISGYATQNYLYAERL